MTLQYPILASIQPNIFGVLTKKKKKGITLSLYCHFHIERSPLGDLMQPYICLFVFSIILYFIFYLVLLRINNKQRKLYE